MKLFFKKTGEGKPLIILHGLFGMSDNWATLARQYSENGFAAYAVDLRNHGRSPHSDTFNYGAMADDVSSLMSDEQLASADFIGHSMGGKVAMFFAGMHPEKVNKLIVTDISPRYYPPHHDGVLDSLRSVDFNVIRSRKEAEVQIRVSIHDEATVQFLLKNLYWKNKGNHEEGVEQELAWRFNLSGIEKNMEAVGEALPESVVFNGPTLFLKGERSGYITSKDEPVIKRHFPKSELKTIAGAGHWVHAEKPVEFLQTTIDFLKS